MNRMRDLHRTAALVALLPLAACYQLKVHAQASYAQMKVAGDLGYVSSGNSPVNINQDFESAFGIGDDQGVPYGRLSIDTGVPVIAVSGFRFDEQGQGVLQADFGNNLQAGVRVLTDLDFTNVKASYALRITLGPVKISPGLAVDYFDFHFQARDTIGIATENVDLQAPVPMGFVRAEVDLGVVSAVGEVGYIKANIQDVTASLLDVEALLQVRPKKWFDLFVGYRSVRIDAKGIVDGNQFNTDLTISGFLVGGGFTF
ncbi:MAG: hypothetical protein ABIP94_04380 [Planctomycetota bacterium]